MRVAAQAAMVCAFVAMIALFLPAGQLDVGGRLAARPTSRSLFQLGKTTGSVRTFLAGYRTSTAKKIGSKALDTLAPHLRGRLGARAADAQDVIATLDELRDDDIATVGLITAVTMWTLLGLNLLVIALVYGTGPGTARLRVAAAVVGSVVAAALAVAVHLVVRRVVAEANAELERTLFTVRVGAYLLPLAAVASTVAVVAWVIGYARLRARGAVAAT